ncbi:hypothetical protein GRF61_22865 [Azoarcus sp. TTM-91]|uniref:hypothetical protein n=1 Tax=Azoarcus sp. TTM-91 TaxID=2691581 RepID=UPI00145CD780|nr:hypothetical protein [Azoarcus sp. TTM-91]NMG37305.1 hypothetical protein [Azoarcus sp. TTM-91]
MKVETGNSYSNQAAQAAASGRSADGSFAAALSAAQAGGAEKVDFTSMTRQEMRDWLNEQIRSGKMALDGSEAFMAMTMKIPVGGSGVEVPAESDSARYDFMGKLSDGILGARSRGDEAALQRLESALQIAQRYQR